MFALLGKEKTSSPQKVNWLMPLLRYRGHFLKLYDYSNEDDKMAALHAKVISVDMSQTLITSANLSYHGQQGNIELGALIESENTAKQLDEVMTQLIFKKIFREV